MYSESPGGPFRGGGGSVGCSKDQKEAMYSFCREIREMRQKSLHAALERTTTGGKDLELNKTYGLPLEHMKDFGLASRIGSIALDRLRTAAPLHGEIAYYVFAIEFWRHIFVTILGVILTLIPRRTHETLRITKYTRN